MERIYETAATAEVIEKLIGFSSDWEEENSTYGYRTNTADDIEGRRIFLADEDGRTVGYLFGKTERSENMRSVTPEGTPYFEVEELYVIPEMRSRGIGRRLFAFAEQAVSDEAEYTVLSMAARNWIPLLKFYTEAAGMEFWSARLFRKTPAKGAENMEHSCGAVVYTMRNGVPLYVVVQQKAGNYSFPKGHTEEGETEIETARREIFEETGLEPEFIGGFRETEEYEVAGSPGTRKTVTYFLAEFEDGQLIPKPVEIRQVRLLPYEEAIRVFDREETRRILTEVNDMLTARDAGTGEDEE